MAVGVTIGEVGASSHGWLLASAGLQSLSVGLFLHLIFIGIIPSEFKRAPRGAGTAGALFMLCMRLGLMVLGWISFLLLMMAFGHKHH